MPEAVLRGRARKRLGHCQAVPHQRRSDHGGKRPDRRTAYRCGHALYSHCTVTAGGTEYGKHDLSDIACRTGGDIYIGVVGPVRSGKSTFIKRFMEQLVIPHIPNEAWRERATDELPQSAAGRTIMTTEPKFIPEDAVELTLEDNARMRYA